MTGIKRSMMSAAGSAGGAEGLYVEDVFATNVWRSDDTNQRGIVNGCDLDGEGGVVWIKGRTNQLNWWWSDTDHPVEETWPGDRAPRMMQTNDPFVSSYNMGVQKFNDNGYNIGANGDTNSGTTKDYVGYTFRKAPGFFDMVEYTGNGSNQTISHNLGSTPGFVIVKKTDGGYGNWSCWHRSYPDKYSRMNSAAANVSAGATRTVTDTTYQIFGSWADEGEDGDDYTIYLFAHDDESFGADSDQSIISCGSYTGGGTPDIDLGWEPQYVIIKCATNSENWFVFDHMRGMDTGTQNAYLELNTADVEDEWGYNVISVRPTGFEIYGGGLNEFNGSHTYQYIAIRRPMKPPEAGTDVFFPYKYRDVGLTSGGETATNRTVIGGIHDDNGDTTFTTDLFMHKKTASGSYGHHVMDRVRGQGKALLTNTTGDQPEGDSASNGRFDLQHGIDVEYNGEMYYYNWNAGGRWHVILQFARATGFFDIAHFIGTGATQNVSHNLGAVPEIIIVKRYDGGQAWSVYTSVTGNGKALQVHTALAATTSSTYWNDTSPTDSVFTLGSNQDFNINNGKHIAYLFASLDGISKIGSYTSTGSAGNIAVTTGFSPRFVMVKNTNYTGNWTMWDSARGITANDDKALYWNLTGGEVADYDIDIEPTSTGFEINRGHENHHSSSSGRVYVYLAIA